ncbi:MAG: glycosyltransferase [Lachnospiraceae bacterium]
MFLNILLPVYNEERRIERGVEGTIDFLSSIGFDDYRITIEDNASTDDTGKKALEMSAKHPQVYYDRLEHKGVGIAFANGVMKNTCEVVGYMDIDLSTDVRHLREVIEIMQADPACMMINGSRWSRESETTGRKWYRNLSSHGLTRLLKIFLKMKASDSICGFKFFRNKFAKELIDESSREERGWFFIIEILLRAERKNVKIHELPVRWKDDYDSKVDYIKVIKNYLSDIKRLRRDFKSEKIL